jgi:predicted TIM-barrel fold metal-dependent hydrolase
MDDAGVDHAIVVHPEPYQDDHRYLEHCLDVGAGRLKGTCLFFADRPESLARMPEFLRRNEGRIIAARLHAYAPGRLPPWGSPELRRLWMLAGDFGIAMQLHLEPRYAPRLEPYLREFSQVPVIIDHMGRPMQGTPAEHAVVLHWSERPQTIMKLSSLPRQDRYPHREVQPVIRQLTDAFGAERMIYGGGFNAEATGTSYRAYRERLRGYLGHLSASDQARILGGNAAARFGFV